MMQVLHERHLKLSLRKTCMGKIELGFHFLGVTYPPTQTEDNTDTMHMNDETMEATRASHMAYQIMLGPKIEANCFDPYQHYFK
jgi:hypothetical protein